jgi:hypothetical protein
VHDGWDDRKRGRVDILIWKIKNGLITENIKKVLEIGWLTEVVSWKYGFDFLIRGYNFVIVCPENWEKGRII